MSAQAPRFSAARYDGRREGWRERTAAFSRGIIGCLLALIAEPGIRETFTPRELVDAYKNFLEHGPQYLNAETGIEGSVYRFGTRVLVIYEEPETEVIVLIHPTS